MEFRGHTDALRDESIVTVNYRISPFGPEDRRPRGADEIPHALGRFRVLEEIARGGMGVVLRAYDTELDRELAVKLLAPGIAPDSEAGRRFAQEARLVSQLCHPGIIPVYEAGTLSDGRGYFAMPYVDGETLAEQLNRRPNRGHDLDRLLRVFERVCRAIAYAHGERVVHRDLKPANVMVGRAGDVVVMDWGVAAPLEPPGRIVEDHTGRWVFGTPAYMPPEQARGRDEAPDPRSDVFGLGAILCEILTGEPPYVGPDVDAVTRLAANGSQTETDQRLVECRADPALIRLARRCLAPDAADRPPDASAVAREIGLYLASAAPAVDRGAQRTWQRWSEVLTAALALVASAAVGATAHEFKVRAAVRNGSPPAAVGLTPTDSPPAHP